MQTLLVYMLKVIAVSGLLLIYYILALRNKRFHYYNRFYLLLTVLLSLLLPFAHFDWFSLNSNSTNAINIYKIIYQSGGENFVIGSGETFNWQQFLIILSAALSCIKLLQLLFRIIKIYHLKKVYPVNKLMEFDFINTDLQSAPFFIFQEHFLA